MLIFSSNNCKLIGTVFDFLHNDESPIVLAHSIDQIIDFLFLLSTLKRGQGSGSSLQLVTGAVSMYRYHCCCLYFILCMEILIYDE